MKLMMIVMLMGISGTAFGQIAIVDCFDCQKGNPNDYRIRNTGPLNGIIQLERNGKKAPEGLWDAYYRQTNEVLK